MVFTDYIRKYLMEDPSILSKKDFEFFDSKVYNDKGKTLDSVVYSPYSTTLIFNKGFVVFAIDKRNTDGFDNDIVCEVVAFYKAKDSERTRDELLTHFWKFLKVNKCTKVIMSTKIKPEFWIKNYGFKLKKYEMELDL